MSRQAVASAIRLPWSVVDAYTATLRYLKRGVRQPDVIFGSVLFPIIFVVLFGYVFGDSIKIPGGDYRSYLMPGLFSQAILLLARSAQAADVIIGIPTFLFGFISNVFVDPANMPAWLRVFANWNPISALVTAGRQLFGNSIGPPPPGVWSLDHAVVTTIGLAILIVAIAAPVCVHRYSRISR